VPTARATPTAEATTTLGLGLVFYYDVMSLVTTFSHQNYAVSAKLAESAKSPESAINELIQQKNYATHFDLTPT